MCCGAQLTLYQPETKYCMYAGCDRLASAIVATAEATTEHPTLGVYCDFHADEVSVERMPDTYEHCPNCGCKISI